MENFLLKLARQLDAMDEASLMALWDKYAAIVSRFEPSKRWEEAALVFALIQAKRWKNQLFNHYWAEHVKPAEGEGKSYDASFSLEVKGKGSADVVTPARKSKILSFTSTTTDKDKKD